MLNKKDRRGIVRVKRRVIRGCDPITISMIAGPDAVTGDTRRALMRRREMLKLRAATKREKMSTSPIEWDKAGYWKVKPKDPNTLLDGNEMEIVYVIFDGKWHVLRLGESKRYKLEDFEWIGPS